MTEEFNLSDKEIKQTWLNTITNESEFVYVIKEEDVKEFIRLLKEEMPNQDINEYKAQMEFIDKLAGDKLG